MPGTNNHSTLEDNLLQNEEQEQQQTLQQPPNTDDRSTPITDESVHQQNTGSYDDIISSITKEFDDMKKKHQEEQKIDAVVAAINGIGDMGRAIGNIYATTHYFPSTFDPQNTMSEKYGERAAKAKAEYDKNRQAMMSYLHKYQKANSDFKFSQEKQSLAQKKWEAEEERKNALNQAKVESYNAMTKYREAIANKNDVLAKQYEEQVLYLQAKQKYLELGFNLKQAESQARIDANEALAEKRRREAGGTTTNTTIERDRQGNETGRTVTRTSNGEGGKKTNPMGGSQAPGNGKKKNPMS